MSSLSELRLFDGIGPLSQGAFDPEAWQALVYSLGYASQGQSGFVHPQHLFLGILLQGGRKVHRWLELLQTDRDHFLAMWEELFGSFPSEVPPELPHLHREFLTDGLIKLLTESLRRTARKRMPLIDIPCLLVCLLSLGNGLIAECFERAGVALDWIVLQAERVEMEIMT